MYLRAIAQNNSGLLAVAAWQHAFHLLLRTSTTPIANQHYRSCTGSLAIKMGKKQKGASSRGWCRIAVGRPNHQAKGLAAVTAARAAALVHHPVAALEALLALPMGSPARRLSPPWGRGSVDQKMGGVTSKQEEEQGDRWKVETKKAANRDAQMKTRKKKHYSRWEEKLNGTPLNPYGYTAENEVEWTDSPILKIGRVSDQIKWEKGFRRSNTGKFRKYGTREVIEEAVIVQPHGSMAQPRRAVDVNRIKKNLPVACVVKFRHQKEGAHVEMLTGPACSGWDGGKYCLVRYPNREDHWIPSDCVYVDGRCVTSEQKKPTETKSKKRKSPPLCQEYGCTTRAHTTTKLLYCIKHSKMPRKMCGSCNQRGARRKNSLCDQCYSLHR